MPKPRPPFARKIRRRRGVALQETSGQKRQKPQPGSPVRLFMLLAGALFRRLFISAAEFQFPENAFALHFLFQRPERLVYIVVTNRDLHS